MPETFSVIEIFDVFFKLHNILDVAYEPNIEPMMNFLAHFMYDFDDNATNGKKKKFVPKIRMHEMFNKFPNPENASQAA